MATKKSPITIQQLITRPLNDYGVIDVTDDEYASISKGILQNQFKHEDVAALWEVISQTTLTSAIHSWLNVYVEEFYNAACNKKTHHDLQYQYDKIPPFIQQSLIDTYFQTTIVTNRATPFLFLGDQSLLWCTTTSILASFKEPHEAISVEYLYNQLTKKDMIAREANAFTLMMLNNNISNHLQLDLVESSKYVGILKDIIVPHLTKSSTTTINVVANIISGTPIKITDVVPPTDIQNAMLGMIYDNLIKCTHNKPTPDYHPKIKQMINHFNFTMDEPNELTRFLKEPQNKDSIIKHMNNSDLLKLIATTFYEYDKPTPTFDRNTMVDMMEHHTIDEITTFANNHNTCFTHAWNYIFYNKQPKWKDVVYKAALHILLNIIRHHQHLLITMPLDWWNNQVIRDNLPQTNNLKPINQHIAIDLINRTDVDPIRQLL